MTGAPSNFTALAAVRPTPLISIRYASQSFFGRSNFRD